MDKTKVYIIQYEGAAGTEMTKTCDSLEDVRLERDALTSLGCTIKSVTGKYINSVKTIEDLAEDIGLSSEEELIEYIATVFINGNLKSFMTYMSDFKECGKIEVILDYYAEKEWFKLILYYAKNI